MPPKNGGKGTAENRGKRKSNSKEELSDAEGPSVSKKGRPSLKEKFVLSEANLQR